MLPQSESGSSDATTRSALSSGTINITDGANQRQDVAGLSRDTVDTNGQVSKLPDVNALLTQQADRMQAAQAAGQAVAQRIGDYADAQAKATGDSAWAEGGDKRAAMQAAGAAVVAGLGGGVGSAVAGAAGAAIGSKMAPMLNELSGSIAASNPTGDTSVNTALGNIVSNVVATGAGAAAGGAGAFSSSNVDAYNRQLHPDEKQAIKDKANGDQTEQDKLTKAACYVSQLTSGIGPLIEHSIEQYVTEHGRKPLALILNPEHLSEFCDGTGSNDTILDRISVIPSPRFDMPVLVDECGNPFEL